MPDIDLKDAPGPDVTLPASRGLAKLSDLRPVICVDTREQHVLPFSRLQCVRGTLMTADYSIVGMLDLFAVERKSVADLVGCCVGQGRARVERELCRLRGHCFRRLLIVGTELDIQNCNYHSNVKPQSVFATLSAFEVRYSLPFVFRPTPELAGRQIESWAYWFTREYVRTCNSLLKASNVAPSS